MVQALWLVLFALSVVTVKPGAFAQTGQVMMSQSLSIGDPDRCDCHLYPLAILPWLVPTPGSIQASLPRHGLVTNRELHSS